VHKRSWQLTARLATTARAGQGDYAAVPRPWDGIIHTGANSSNGGTPLQNYVQAPIQNDPFNAVATVHVPDGSQPAKPAGRTASVDGAQGSAVNGVNGA